MNIVGLSSTTNPYIQARWTAFSQTNPQYTVTHIEFGRVSRIYHWQPVEVKVPYSRIVLSDEPSQYESVQQLLNLLKALFKALEQSKPDVIVLNGYQQPATLGALIWSFFHRKPVVLLSESKEDDAPRKLLIEFLKKILITRYDSALVGGKKHKNYLINLGMTEQAIFLGHNVVGNNAYHPNHLSQLSHPSEPCQKYFLSVNRFIDRKNISTIVDAYSEYRKNCLFEPWDLILCGDGETRPRIEAQIQALGLNDHISLPGFLQPNELLPYFAHASCFIHASTQEQWGLVVNEAMAAGIPVIVSRCCGCFDELVMEGINGFGFDPYQPSELADLMAKLSCKDFKLQQMKQAALEHIENFGPHFFAEGLHNAIQYAVTHNS